MLLNENSLAKDPAREQILMRKAAVLLAEGKMTDKQIARELQITVGTLQTFKKSPLFQEHIATMAEEITEKGVESIIDKLRDDGPRNVDFIKRTRDGHFRDPKEKMDLRLRAAKMLLDKQAPSADAAAQAAEAGRIVINARLLGQMLRAMKNVDAIDITPEEIEKATDANAIPRIGAKTPEEFAETYVPPTQDEE